MIGGGVRVFATCAGLHAGDFKLSLLFVPTGSVADGVQVFRLAKTGGGLEIHIAEPELTANFVLAFLNKLIFGEAFSILEADSALGAVGEYSLGAVARVDVVEDEPWGALATSVTW